MRLRWPLSGTEALLVAPGNRSALSGDHRGIGQELARLPSTCWWLVSSWQRCGVPRPVRGAPPAVYGRVPPLVVLHWTGSRHAVVTWCLRPGTNNRGWLSVPAGGIRVEIYEMDGEVLAAPAKLESLLCAILGEFVWWWCALFGCGRNTPRTIRSSPHSAYRRRRNVETVTSYQS